MEDDIYFQTIDRDTIFLLLCPGERWLPPGVEALRAGKNSQIFVNSIKVIATLYTLLFKFFLAVAY